MVVVVARMAENAAGARTTQHEQIAKVARLQNSEASKFNNGVSIHRMAQSISFSNMRAVLLAATGQESKTFVGTMDGRIVLSVNFNYEPPRTPPQAARSKKRTRDPHEDAVDHAVERVKRGLRSEDDVDEDMLSSARTALLCMLRQLRGANDESVVESWGLSYKKPEQPGAGAGGGAARPRLILSARLTPGVPVPVPSLFQCLGVRCTSDGMLTTQDSTGLASGFSLPLSEEAKAAELHGQRALTLFATVAK